MLLATPAPASSRLFALLRFIHDRNPFYLLSALSMFVGFRVVLGALNSAPSDWKTLLLLIATLHVYELAIIALAMFLIVRRGLKRDGWILLGIDALFLVDLTNLNAELFTAMPRLGAVVNAACFVLAIAKIIVVVHVLGLELTTGMAVYVCGQLAFLLGLPGIFYLMRSSSAVVSPMQIYGIWWLVALLIAGGALLLKRDHASDHPMSALPWRLYVVVPLISLLVHLAGENRVYWVHFHPANIAPLLLAAVFALGQSKYRWHAFALPASMALIMLAIAASVVPHVYQHEAVNSLAWIRPFTTAGDYAGVDGADDSSGASALFLVGSPHRRDVWAACVARCNARVRCSPTVCGLPAIPWIFQWISFPTLHCNGEFQRSFIVPAAGRWCDIQLAKSPAGCCRGGDGIMLKPRQCPLRHRPDATLTETLDEFMPQKDVGCGRSFKPTRPRLLCLRVHWQRDCPAKFSR